MISLLKYWVAILGHGLLSFEEYMRLLFSSLSSWLKFKVQNDLIHCQEEAEEEEIDEHLHSHFLGPKFSHSLEQIAYNTHTHTLKMHFLEPVAATPAHASYSDSMDIATIFVSSSWIGLQTQNSHHCNMGGKKRNHVEQQSPC
jgi:hypothetical protein